MADLLRVYTPKEASIFLHCHPRTVRNWCIKNKLGTQHKTGSGKRHIWVLTQADLDTLRNTIQQRIVRRNEHGNVI